MYIQELYKNYGIWHFIAVSISGSIGNVNVCIDIEEDNCAMAIVFPLRLWPILYFLGAHHQAQENLR
jgi:hypothetical protein